MKMEYSINARSKCQLCKAKIVTGAWRTLLAVEQMYSSSGRAQWQSAHAACHLHNLATGTATRPTTQSMPYWGSGPAAGWDTLPTLTLPTSGDGDAVAAVVVSLTANAGTAAAARPLQELLPTPALRSCLAAAVEVAIPGAGGLGEKEQEILQVVCLRQGQLCERTTALLVNFAFKMIKLALK